MIRVAVLYPHTPGSTFDVDYYKTVHMRLVQDKLTPLGLLGCEVDAAVEAEGESPPYAAIGYMFFDSAQQFQAAFDAVGDQLIADVPNYTNIEPVIQISQYYRL